MEYDRTVRTGDTGILQKPEMVCTAFAECPAFICTDAVNAFLLSEEGVQDFFKVILIRSFFHSGSV